MDDVNMDAAAMDCDDADLKTIQESIASVLAEECGSLAVHAYIDGKTGLVEALEEQARALGWLAIGLPEALGGFGLGARGLSLLHLELGRVIAPGSFLPTSVAAQAMAEAGLTQGGGDWLPRLASGELSAAIPATVDKGVMRAADGALSGRITLLGQSGTTCGLVPVGDAELAIVDLRDAVCAPLDFWDRTRTLTEVMLDGTRPVGWVGQDGSGRRSLSRAFAIAVAADSIGLAKGIADATIAYMKERTQFGRAIGSFQALKHRAVDIVARIGVAEHVLGQAVEAAAAGDVSSDMWARLAKAAASEAAAFVAGDCVQLHGGVGYTWEFDVHLYLKRARLNEMLVADNLTLRDQAAAELAQVTRAGTSSLELPAL